MPTIVQESVDYYQNYDDAEQYRDQAMVTHAAVNLASALISGQDNAMEEVFDDPVFADLNLYEDDIEAVQEQSEKVRAALGAMRS